MCGIAGILGGADSEGDGAQVRGMVDAMRHRGPDDSGVERIGKAWLGHARLSVLDLSRDGHQPMANEDGSVWVTFNGEIYNFMELRAELEAAGHRFRSKADTEVLVHLYEEDGEAMVNRLDGMFAFAIWDATRGRCLLARDRFGEKPLFYSEDGGRLSFASEIGVVARLPWVRRETDDAALGLFWQMHYIPSPWTAYRGVRKLPSGCTALWNGGTLKVSRYHPRPVVPFAGDFDAAAGRFGELFERSVRRCLVADVEVGLALSAGMDSSCVAAVAARHQKVRAMTVDFEGAASARSEASVAEGTARRLGLPHSRLCARLDVLRDVDSLTRDLGEPFLDSAAFPARAIYEALGRGCKVVLGGDGGDEVVGGYGKYARWWRVRVGVWLARSGAASSMEGLVGHLYEGGDALRNRLKPVACGLGTLASPGFAHRPGRWLLTETTADQRRLFRTEEGWWGEDAAVMELEERLTAACGSGDSARLCLEKELQDVLPDKMLRKIDVASMHHGVEARSPFLDHHLVDHARSLPDSFLWSDGRGKRLLRAWAGRMLPPDVLNRPKTGFAFPLRETLAGQADAVRERLCDSVALGAWCRREELERVIEEHCAGRPWHTTLILKLLTLAAWADARGATTRG